MKRVTKHARTGSAILLGLWLAVWSATALAAPLTAEEAVALALANQLDIKKAVNSQQQADEALRSAKGA